MIEWIDPKLNDYQINTFPPELISLIIYMIYFNLLNKLHIYCKNASVLEF